jgi:hypothetical protein
MSVATLDPDVRFAVPSGDGKHVLWVVLKKGSERWKGVPSEAVPIASPEFPPVADNEIPAELRKGLEAAGQDTHVVVKVPVERMRGAQLELLGPGHAFQPPKKPTHYRATHPFNLLMQLLRPNELPEHWSQLKPGQWRLPSTSGDFWADAEFPRDVHENGRQIRFTVALVEAYVKRLGYEPYWIKNNTSLTWLRKNVVNLTAANAYRMAELLGRENRFNEGLPKHSSQQFGEEPQEYRAPSAARDELTEQWDRKWPNHIAKDTTVAFLNECLAAMKLMSKDERVQFLAMQVYGLEENRFDEYGRERPGQGPISMAECIGRAWTYVRDQQLKAGNGLIFVPRDANDCWEMWADSVPSNQLEGGIYMPDEPIAPIELQARTYDMLTGFGDLLAEDARVADLLRSSMGVSEMRSRAERLVEQVERFEVESGGERWLANAMTKSGRLIKPAGVNMGLVLETKLIDQLPSGLRDGVVRKLASISVGFGIPTRDLNAKGSQPDGYHHGTPWKWVQAVTCRGLLKFDLCRAARTLGQKAIGDIPESYELTSADGKLSSDIGTFWSQYVINDGRPGIAPRVTRGAHPHGPFPQKRQLWSVGADVQEAVASQIVAFLVEEQEKELAKHEKKLRAALQAGSLDEEQVRLVAEAAARNVDEEYAQLIADAADQSRKAFELDPRASFPPDEDFRLTVELSRSQPTLS